MDTKTVFKAFVGVLASGQIAVIIKGVPTCQPVYDGITSGY